MRIMFMIVRILLLIFTGLYFAAPNAVEIAGVAALLMLATFLECMLSLSPHRRVRYV